MWLSALIACRRRLDSSFSQVFIGKQQVNLLTKVASVNSRRAVTTETAISMLLKSTKLR